MENSVKIYKNHTGSSGSYHGGGIYVNSGEALLILDSSTKDEENTATSDGQLYYIGSGVKILAGSTLNGTEYTSDYVVTTTEAPIKDD